MRRPALPASGQHRRRVVAHERQDLEALRNARGDQPAAQRRGAAEANQYWTRRSVERRAPTPPAVEGGRDYRRSRKRLDMKCAIVTGGDPGHDFGICGAQEDLGTRRGRAVGLEHDTIHYSEVTSRTGHHNIESGLRARRHQGQWLLLAVGQYLLLRRSGSCPGAATVGSDLWSRWRRPWKRRRA